VAHVALQLAGAVTTTLAEGEVTFTSSNGEMLPLALSVAAAAVECGDRLLVHATHPSGKDTIYFFTTNLDVP
jgi:hypothetical protein